MGPSGQGESTSVCGERIKGVDTQLEGLDVDNDEENDDNDEDMEDGGDEENGDEADEDEAEDGEADLPPPPTATTALAAVPAGAPPTAAATKALEPPIEETKPELPVPTVTVQGVEPTPLEPTKPSPAAAATPTPELTEPIGVAAAAEIPSNAIEVSNIAPSAEVGHGDLGAGGGMEITRPEPSVSPSLGAASAPLAPETAVGAVEEPSVSAETAAEAAPASASTVEEKMDVDGPSDPTAEEPVAPVDEGLVMGEMHAPQPAMEVVGSDAGPKETE